MVVKAWRFANWLYLHRLILPARMVRFCLLLLFNCSLPVEVTPGEDLRLPHCGRGVGVNAQTRFGKDVVLNSLAHLATDVPRGSGKYMVIGDRVSIGTCAVLVGPIEIGDDAVVGAGSVVTKSVPPGAIVAGNPARVLNMNGREFNAKRLRRPLTAA